MECHVCVPLFTFAARDDCVYCRCCYFLFSGEIFSLHFVPRILSSLSVWMIKGRRKKGFFLFFFRFFSTTSSASLFPSSWFLKLVIMLRFTCDSCTFSLCPPLFPWCELCVLEKEKEGTDDGCVSSSFFKNSNEWCFSSLFPLEPA